MLSNDRIGMRENTSNATKTVIQLCEGFIEDGNADEDLVASEEERKEYSRTLSIWKQSNAIGGIVEEQLVYEMGHEIKTVLPK